MREKNNKKANPTMEFKNAMSFVNGFLEQEKSIEYKLIALDFILEVVNEDLKTDLLSYIFYSEVDFDRQLDYPFPLQYFDEQSEQHDITELFPHVCTDGQNWYNAHTDETIGDVIDFRVSIIYEIAKVKHQLEKI